VKYPASATAVLAVLGLTLAHTGCAPEQPVRLASGRPQAARRAITTAAITPDQPFSSGVLVGETLYLAAQPGRHPSDQGPAPGIRQQTRYAMGKIGAVLENAGLAYHNLVKCHVYLANMDEYAGMNETYRDFFRERVPARTTVQAAGLPHGAGVEIACIAYTDVSRVSVVVPPRGSIPAPLGPYSAGVWAGDTLYLSGMGGQFPDGRAPQANLGEQVGQTLTNIGTSLGAAGLASSDVVAGEAYVTSPPEAAAFEPAYSTFFGSSRAHPRMMVFLPRLPGPIKVEITLIAARKSVPRRLIPSAAGAGGPARGLRAGDVLYTRAESAAGVRFEEQYRAVLGRQDATLRAAGLGWADVVDVQVYLTDLDDTKDLDSLFRERFPLNPPARTIVQVHPRSAELVQSSLVAVARDGAR
jgi:2-iminobutanoate/2-iminopropanoate deaminase